MSKCREAFEKQYGEDFNPDNSPVASVWQAAWNAATQNALEVCRGQMLKSDWPRNPNDCAEAIEQEKA